MAMVRYRVFPSPCNHMAKNCLNLLFGFDFMVNSLTDVMGPSSKSESNLLIRAVTWK